MVHSDGDGIWMAWESKIFFEQNFHGKPWHVFFNGRGIRIEMNGGKDLACPSIVHHSKCYPLGMRE